MSAHSFHQDILPLFEESRADWLARARRIAHQLGRTGATVTVDDVRSRCPPLPGQDPRKFGAVFLKDQWVKVGYANSTRATCHRRPIFLFRLRAAVGREAAR